MHIPFNQPYMTGKELWNVARAHANGHLAGDGQFTDECHRWLEQRTGSCRALLTHSCTAALEMAAILAGLQAGDEVILPSYTFVSTANAIVLRGAVPVFVDIRADTLNLDENLIEAAITERTRAIICVHYAGVSCEMDSILHIARKHNLLVIEDAAQGIMSSYKGKALGTIGTFGTLSFHETKNIICGEGGALLINDATQVESAEIIREKGTNRSRFFRGEVDKYTWVEVGSSYLPSELVAAFLSAQMDEADQITARRLAIWQRYHTLLEPMEKAGLLRRPVIPAECQHNAHMYYILLPDLQTRAHLIGTLKEKGVHAVFHYVPLHDSPAGSHYGRTASVMDNTLMASECLLRLPLWLGVEQHQEYIVEQIVASLAGLRFRHAIAVE